MEKHGEPAKSETCLGRKRAEKADGRGLVFLRGKKDLELTKSC